MNTKISDLRVGDTVAIIQQRRVLSGAPPYSLDWVVIKITPTGQITVQKSDTTNKRRFDKRGIEIGVGNYFPSLEPDHLKAVREVHLWQLLDNVRKAIDAMRHELNSGAMPATYLEHTNLNAKLAELRTTYGKAVWEAHKQGALS